jgi:hypothetical protein
MSGVEGKRRNEIRGIGVRGITLRFSVALVGSSLSECWYERFVQKLFTYVRGHPPWDVLRRQTAWHAWWGGRIRWRPEVASRALRLCA